MSARSLIHDREMKGLGHAILSGESLVGDQPFGVVLADDLCINAEGKGVLAQMAQLKPGVKTGGQVFNYACAVARL